MSDRWTARRKWVFVVRPTSRTSVAQGFFWWVRAQSRRPDTPTGFQNASNPVGICLRSQAIKVAPPRRVRAWGTTPETRRCRSWCAQHQCQLTEIEVRQPRPIVSEARTNPAGSVYRRTRPTEVCPSPALRGSRYLLYVPTTGRVWHKAF